MNHKRSAQLILRRAGRLIVLLVSVIAMTGLIKVPVSAGTPTFPYVRFQQRSLAVGTTNPDATTTYTFKWQYPNASPIGSLEFLFCTDPYFLDPCTTPVGASFATATLTTQLGATGFSIANQTAQRIELTRAPSVPAGGINTYVFSNVHNPTNIETIYIRVWAYPTTDTSGPQAAVASVLSSTVEPVQISTIVPPTLFFCVGITVPLDCRDSPPVGDLIDYGQLDSTSVKFGTSQFSAGTNAENGYIVTVNGNTMTSGNKIIPALAVLSASSPGVAQFGLNLRANSSPPAGIDVTGIGSGAVAPGYDTPDAFKFGNGDIVASTTQATYFNRYTQTYIVNVPPDQAAGIYTTTITYICTGAF